MKKKCDKCNQKAVWVYIPGSAEKGYYCDDCVPRGCFCNFEERDEKGRKVPCVEYDYEEKGFSSQDYQKNLGLMNLVIK